MTTNDDNEPGWLHAEGSTRTTPPSDITFMYEINSTERVDSGVSADRSKRQHGIGCRPTGVVRGATDVIRLTSCHFIVVA